MSLIPEADEDSIAVAGQVLKAIKQLDPGFYNADLDMARAWARILGPSDYTLNEMLAGVLEFYRTETRGRRCMPANVLECARIARERATRTPEGKRRLEARRQARRQALDERIAQAKAHELPAPAREHKPLPKELQEKLQQAAERAKQ